MNTLTALYELALPAIERVVRGRVWFDRTLADDLVADASLLFVRMATAGRTIDRIVRAVNDHVGNVLRMRKRREVILAKMRISGDEAHLTTQPPDWWRTLLEALTPHGEQAVMLAIETCRVGRGMSYTRQANELRKRLSEMGWKRRRIRRVFREVREALREAS